MKKYFLLIIGLVLLVYSIFLEPNCLTVINYKIHDKELSGIKAVFVGDLHLKPNQEKRLQEIVTKINEQEPDVILSVGDFVNGHELNSTLPIKTIAKHLGELKAKNGIYTVLGNHDWWIDGEVLSEELEKVGIKVLANSNVSVQVKDKYISIAGVEDLYTRTPKIFKALDGAKKPTILLTHSPDVFPKVPGVNRGVNLTLAGHVHGGQIRIPFIGAVVVPSNYGDKYSQGLITKKNKKMIVTRGIGTSILPIRFNCIPEIVVIEFE